ncbi:NAD-dependent epimerase/dehydratase family protein [Oscillatoriales cyanobacterium LEGE 11467]|uniref:NAD-dependent epimerase/dehydratase family protein n=1 Tax=Zarconia navalis LEGE 11467 TaxID=1828826 RepID=A0A928VYI8_9CYAN|nr:NAD-dependent epimerase/dehydratase family protein [Zarconia navalis]MBE9040085.1 NAD-dependent epimerase/dehydratase family protein [Zarconia navalis LEGE 11467]
MKVLVTGATGYAGFYAAIALRQAGHQVYGLVRDESKPRARELQRYEVQLVSGDIANPETYRHYLESCDVSIHAMMDFQAPQESDRKLFETLKQVAEAAPRNRLFIYTTGCSIYGKRPERVMDESTPANPDHALAFRMDLERELFDIPIDRCRKVVLRPGFMYGLDAHSSITGMWFEMGERGEAIYRGDRDKGWSWVHISDLARAYVNVAECTAPIDKEVFCIADEQRPKCIEVMRACLKAANYNGDIQFAEPQEDDVTSTWFDQNEFITSQKARSLLGWVPHHTGVIDEIETYYMAWKAARS